MGCLRWRRLGRAGRWLVFYLLLCAFTTLGLEAYALAGRKNWALIHLFAPVQLAAFAWIYAEWTPRWAGAIFKLAAAGFAVACLVLLPSADLGRFSGPTFHVQTLLLMGFSLALLCHLAVQVEVPLLEHPGAWVAAGVLCDMAVSLVLYAGRDWLLAHAAAWAMWLSLGRSGVVALSYLFFLRALLLGGASK